MFLSFSCLVVVFLRYFVPVTVNGTILSLFFQLFLCSRLFCFCFSIVFLLFSRNVPLISLSCCCFLLYFVPVTVGTVLSLFCFRFSVIFLMLSLFPVLSIRLVFLS